LPLALHALAVAAFGVMAGFFWTYSANVNLAMLTVDGATYATVQSAFNRHVRHALRAGSGVLARHVPDHLHDGHDRLHGHMSRPPDRPRQLRRLRHHLPHGSGLLDGRVPRVVRDGPQQLHGLVPRPRHRP